MKNKKQVVILVAILIVIAIIIAITMKNKNKDKTKTKFENNIATSEVTLDKIEFRDITKEYNEGITTIKANVYNNTSSTKSINVKIVLKNEKGEEVKSMIQIIENIEPKKKKRLSTGIIGDYTNVKEVEFKVISNEEIEEYNK